MSFNFGEDTLNAVKTTVGQMGSFVGSIAKKAKTLVAGWITGGGPLTRLWSGICDAFDAVIAKFKTAVEEKPLVVFGVGAAVVVAVGLLIVFVGPGMIGKFISGCIKAIGTAVASVVQAIKSVISGLFRRS